MDNSSFQQQESGMQQKRGFSTGMQTFDNILSLIRHYLNWLAGFFQLTEEERENAGVFLGRLGNE
jgi:hypothetical protein